MTESTYALVARSLALVGSLFEEGISVNRTFWLASIVIALPATDAL